MVDSCRVLSLRPKPVNSRPPHRARGFTLVELIAVIIILGILAAVIVPRYAGMVDKVLNVTSSAAASEAVTRLRGATNLFTVNTGNPPQALSDLADQQYLNLSAGNKVSIGSYDAAYTHNPSGKEVSIAITSTGEGEVLASTTITWP